MLDVRRVSNHQGVFRANSGRKSGFRTWFSVTSGDSNLRGLRLVMMKRAEAALVEWNCEKLWCGLRCTDRGLVGFAGLGFRVPTGSVPGTTNSAKYLDICRRCLFSYCSGNHKSNSAEGCEPLSAYDNT